jgi:hypothetical protein
MALKGASESKLADSGRRAPSDPVARRRFEFSQAIEENRDQWGRPKILLPDGSKEVGYRRASSYGAPLEDTSALEKWKLRQVARGVSQRSALQLAVTRSEIGLLSGEWDEEKAAKKELDVLCEQAMEVVGSGEKAVIGTAEHHIFEKVDLGLDPGHIPERWKPDLTAYKELTRGFESVAVELFVVQDEHRVAGTLDRCVRLLHDHEAPDGTVLEKGTVIIGDVKTAQRMNFAGGKFAVQCWVYATGTPYDPVNKIRTPWEHEPPSRDWACIFHVASGSGQARLYWVDLRAAAEAAVVAREVYEWRNKLGKAMISAAPENFAATVAMAQDMQDLVEAHQRAVATKVWDDALKALFSARRRELAA